MCVCVCVCVCVLNCVLDFFAPVIFPSNSFHFPLQSLSGFICVVVVIIIIYFLLMLYLSVAFCNNISL